MEFAEFLKDNYEIVERRVREVTERLLGIPYQHNGRTRAGVDCLGLVYLFFKELGIEFPIDDKRGYIAQDWYKTEPDRYITGLRNIGVEVGHFRNLRILDIPYFTLYKNVVTHTGVMIDSQHFIHILTGKEVSIDGFEKRFWRHKYAGGRRLF